MVVSDCCPMSPNTCWASRVVVYNGGAMTPTSSWTAWIVVCCYPFLVLGSLVGVRIFRVLLQPTAMVVSDCCPMSPNTCWASRVVVYNGGAMTPTSSWTAWIVVCCYPFLVLGILVGVRIF